MDCDGDVGVIRLADVCDAVVVFELSWLDVNRPVACGYRSGEKGMGLQGSHFGWRHDGAAIFSVAVVCGACAEPAGKGGVAGGRTAVDHQCAIYAARTHRPGYRDSLPRNLRD